MPGHDPPQKFHVAGIGASAGGLAALRTLLGHMPAKSGMAFVVVVHLSPEHESHLPRLLQSYTDMPVQQVTETMPLEANHVYVIPPNANLSTVDSHLRLTDLEERRPERAPIDHFLHTLSTTHDGGGIGVLLTGAGADGVLGLRQIRNHGGLTIAQDPDEAEFDSMPRHAIASGAADLVLELRDMPEAMRRFCATRPKISVAQRDAAPESEHELLQEILHQLQSVTGRNFAMYTDTVLLRRICRRMQLHGIESLASYLEKLRERVPEAEALAEDLEFRITEFFQDADLYQRIEQEIIPELFHYKAGAQDRIRCWSVGCSTGEEAYSLAILLLEAGERLKVRPGLQIFATDRSKGLLAHARQGAYPREACAGISAQRIKRYFDSRAQHFLLVTPKVRAICAFAEHDLFTDPPYAHLDLIVCRTLLSDLEPDVRRGLLAVFHYALEAHGRLIVGAGDELDDSDLFVPAGKQGSVYQKVGARRRYFDFPPALRPFGPVEVRGDAAPTPAGAPNPAILHRLALERHCPASLLVAPDNTVAHYSATAGHYLHWPGGALTHDIVRLVPPPVGAVLRSGLDLVRREGNRWGSQPIALERAGVTRNVRLHVMPVPEAREFLFVMLEEVEPAAQQRSGFTDHLRIVSLLEEQLGEANQRLHEILEQRRGPAEDLAAANESLESMNEELRFTLDALDSSREEMKAVNEELATLDVENRHRLAQLEELSGDLHHLLESTGVATLFLDAQLKIVRFNRQVEQLFNLRLADRGRPLSDISHHLHYEELEADARLVLENHVSCDREVAGLDGRWHLARMLPYHAAANGAVEGVVLSFIDITARKLAEDALHETDRRKDEFLALLGHELRNPLAPIISGLEVLRMAPDDKSIVDQITGAMTRQAQQLVRLVDDLLEVSRVTGGRLRLQKSRVLLADVISDALVAVSGLSGKQEHQISVEVPDEPIAIDADPVRLAQVLTNLLNNAVKFTPRNGMITLTARREGDQAVVVVEDEGIGISEDALRQVFDMFYQEGSSEAPRRGGLGIGLTLARSLVEMHGGTLTAESGGPNQGSRFTVRLPIRSALPAFERAPGGATEHGSRERRVLIVDDNKDAAELLEMELRSLGMRQVHTVFNGADALQSAAKHPPDIVLLDLKMPQMDGFEVARRMRREPWGKGLFIVSLSGWGQEIHIRQSREAGFDWHITKPADRTELEVVLAGAPDRPSAGL